MSSKYSPLKNYLLHLSEAQKELTLSFQQIERILNDKLPPSAFQHLSWWAFERYPRPVQKVAISEANWKVISVSLTEGWVKFVRLY